MLLSRFWLVVLALALGGSVFSLFVAQQMYNRAGHEAMEHALRADSSAVGWYLRDDSRKRASALIPFILSPEVVEGLAKASGESKIDRDTRLKTQNALRKLSEGVDPEQKFDIVWAVDINGRVVSAVGFQHNEEWELGGYASVADALHGWIRDDAWVWRGRIYRIVVRPVEKEAQSEPVGAIIGARYVDDDFARAVAKRTGAAVGFYAEGARVASGAPVDFDKSNLDEITRDLKQLDTNKDYQEKGRSEVRVLGEHLGVVYARLPGEAWDLGAGFAVGRIATSVNGPFDFIFKMLDIDKQKVPSVLIVLGIVVVAAFGLALTFVEHTRPLQNFRGEAARLASGKIDVLQPSRFRGAYKKIAADINDGIEKVVVKGGGSRKAADLEQVLGPIPAQPQMSAFSVPGPGGAPSEAQQQSRPSFPKAPVPSGGAQRLRQSGQSGMMAAVVPPVPATTPVPVAPAIPPAPPSSEEAEPFESGDEPPAAPKPQPAAAAKAQPPPPPKRPVAPAAAPQPGPADSVAVAEQSRFTDPTPGDGFDELADWRRVYEEFLSVKRQCGEPTAPLTFEKFKGTLQRNKDALVARHGCSRVKFTVYVKDGKAALKASPVK